MSDDQIKALMDEGLNGSQIAREVGLTPQAISLRLKRIRENEADRNNYVLPWSVREVHATGYVYRAVLAYAKGRKGEALNAREQSERAALEARLAEYDAVVTYDYNQGFMLRNRRKDDGPSLLV